MRGRGGFQREAGAASTAGTGSPREADASGAGVAGRPGAGTARMTSAAGAGTARMAGADRALSSREWPMRPRRASHASLARPGRPVVQGHGIGHRQLLPRRQLFRVLSKQCTDKVKKNDFKHDCSTRRKKKVRNGTKQWVCKKVKGFLIEDAMGG
ncbi:uncharacterized protein [Miscanthus floridulus]|uniref:uncharacterized protein n=1 Tax=Miscanthus floridulus TaxID=154761 RepID=UPI00345AF0DE